MKDKDKQNKVNEYFANTLIGNCKKIVEQVDKEIEEMATFMETTWTKNIIIGDKWKWFAEELLKHYQPKLHEDSVVLSREQFKILCEDKVEITHLSIDEEFKKECEYGIKQARKETAEKILRAFEYCNDKTFYAEWLKLCKQFGVEIKE